MSYTPINVSAFVAAYSGAIAGMATPGWLVDPTQANYDLVTKIAGSFAQAFDTAWNDATQLNNLEIASITSITSNDFAKRGPGPLADPTFQTVGNWTQAARACAALVLESDAYFAGQGINPGIPITGSGYSTVEVNGVPLTQEAILNFVGTDVHGSTVGSVTTITFGAESVSIGQSSASLLEVGASVVNPAFTAAYAVAPTTATLTDTEGHTDDITSTPTSFVSPHTFTKAVYGQQVTFTVAVTSSEGPANGSATKSWVQTVRWGNVVDPGSGYNSAFIAALNHSSLQFGANGTFAANAAVGESEFYAARAAFGVTSLNFTVNGLPFAITKVAANVPYTNASGVTENYDVWKSDLTGLGAFNFVVSGT
jgi:hypothetical protein